MYKRFDDFLDQQQAKTGLPTMDLQQRKDDWLNAIRDLYQVIQSILRPYTSNQRIFFTQDHSYIHEEQLGRYEVETARIMWQGDGHSHVELDPIGTFIIGGRGRVDMVGPTGKAVKLLLVRKDAMSPAAKIKAGSSFAPPSSPTPEQSDDEAAWVWKITTPPPEIYYLDLTEEHFLDALMYVMER